MVKRQKVRYEFYKFMSPQIGISYSQTLVLGNPASLKFICYTRTGSISGEATINNTITLNTFSEIMANTATYNNELILENNQSEQDFTDYTINLFNCQIFIIAKYYID